MDWIGKKVFLRLKCGKVYSGKIIDVDDKDTYPTFLTILDKFDKRVTFVHSEIIEIKEEE